MAFRFQLRRDTAAIWSAVNPVLLIGELAYETNTNKLKIGDGTNTWNNLPYFLDSVNSVNGQDGDVVLYTDDISESGPTAANLWFTPARVANTLLAGENISLSYSSITEKVTITSSGNIGFPDGTYLTGGVPLPILDGSGTTGAFYIGVTSAAVLGNFGIGTTGANAILQIDSTTSGVVMPRMTATQKNAIISPTIGMVIYQTDGTEGLYQYKSTGWETIDPGDISGTTNYVSKFTSGNVLGDSLIYDSGTSVSIGTTGAHSSALLQITSTTKGFLGPKMTGVQRDAIAGPTAGILIYNTDTNKLNLWDGTKWAPAGGGLKLIGDASLQQQPLQVQDASDNSSTFYLGATSQGFLGSVGIGTTGPLAVLEIQSTTSGLLLPRMSKVQRDAIIPIVGLVIYQTTFPEGAYQYKTTGWEPIDPGEISGTAGRVAKFTDNSVVGDSSIYDDGSSVWIGATGATASSVFSVSSTTKGIQIPSMTSGQKNSIASPADGLLLFETGPTGALNQYINSVGWVQYLHDNAGLTGGTQYIYGDLVVSGTLYAAAKSFNIPNPEKPGKKLVYGVAEAPEHSVFYRGRSRTSKIILPDEWRWLVDEDSITVQLTPAGRWSKLVVEKIENNTVHVKDVSPLSWFRNRGKYNFFYFVQAERKDIPKLDINQ